VRITPYDLLGADNTTWFYTNPSTARFRVDDVNNDYAGATNFTQNGQYFDNAYALPKGDAATGIFDLYFWVNVPNLLAQYYRTCTPDNPAICSGGGSWVIAVS